MGLKRHWVWTLRYKPFGMQRNEQPGRPLSTRELYSSISHYQQLVFRKYRLLAIQATVNTLVGLCRGLVLTAILALALLFGSLGLAFYLGETTGSVALGFVWVGAGYAVLFAGLWLARKHVFKDGLARVFLNQIRAQWS